MMEILTKSMFLNLPAEEKLKICNARLDEIYNLGQTTKDFGKGQLEFSYGWASKILTGEGYNYDRNNKQFVKVNELSHAPVSRNTKNKMVIDPTLMPLNEEEFCLLKRLLDDYKNKEEYKTFEPLLRKMVNMEGKTTKFTVKNDVFEQWKVFAGQYNYVSNSDLVSAALLFFIQHFGDINKNT